MEHTKYRPRMRPARACAIATAALCLAGGISSTSWAASPSSHGMQKMFDQADRDGDGRLSRDEYGLLTPATAATGGAAPDGMPATEHQAAVIDRFEDRDRDGDGYVTTEELADQRARD